ncbi:unnamed protein product [Schistosoma haematobium]|nr:unnamed protein product [Schistosoma haematobium]
MDLDFSYLSVVDSSNETQQSNTNYLGSSINSNKAEYNMDGKIETTLCEFSGQSDTPLSVPSVFPNVPLLASCQFNDFFGTSRVFGFGESVPYEDIMKPTLTPKGNFCVERDCERLLNAMDRLKIRERETVDVMGRRSVVQRIAILQKYKFLYIDNLFAIFNSILTGCLKDCLIALCYTPAEFDAIELHRAMRGTDTDEDTIIEILCTRTNEQIKRIKNVYPKLFYGRDLEDDVNDNTEHPFKSIYIALLKSNRDEFTFIDGNLVRRDVEELLRAMKQDIKIDESKFMPILITRSYGHLRAVFNEYSLHSERDLEEEMRGHAVDCILSIVRCIQNRPRYFAEKLVKATENAEKDYGTINRIIVSRCEVDMGRIMEEFLDLKGEPLYKCIECFRNDSSNQIKSIFVRHLLNWALNNYRCLLLKLING